MLSPTAPVACEIVTTRVVIGSSQMGAPKWPPNPLTFVAARRSRGTPLSLFRAAGLYPDARLRSRTDRGDRDGHTRCEPPGRHADHARAPPRPARRVAVR